MIVVFNCFNIFIYMKLKMESGKIKNRDFLFYEFKFRNITINIVINIAKHMCRQDCIERIT